MNKSENTELLIIEKAPSKHPIYKNYNKCSSHLIDGYVVYIEPKKRTTAVTYPQYDPVHKAFNWFSYALDYCCSRSTMELTLADVLIGGEADEIEELCSIFNISSTERNLSKLSTFKIV